MTTLPQPSSPILHLTPNPPGSFARPMPWRKHTRAVRTIPDVAALNRADWSRLLDLLDIASSSFPRWHIRAADESLRKALDYGSVSRWFQFLAYLIEHELFYCCDDGSLLPSPCLCPDEEDYPPLPSVDQSIANLKLRSADLGQEPDFFKAITPVNERQIVRRAFLQYLSDLRAQGLPIPPDEATDRRTYKIAHTAFKVRFLPLLRDTGARSLPLDAIADVWQPETGQDSQSPTTPPVTQEQAQKRDTENLSQTPVTPDVTDFLSVRASQTPDSDSAVSSALPQKQAESHSNNSSSSERDKNQKRDTGDLSHFAVTPENVTLSEADQKTDVVALLSVEGVPCPKGVLALISRDVALVLAETPDILEIARRQAEYLPFRKLERGEWGGLWRKSIEHNWPPPDAYIEYRRAEDQKAAQVKKQAAAQIKQAALAQRADLEKQLVQDYWEQFSDSEKVELETAAANRLPSLWRERYNACSSRRMPLPEVVRAQLDHHLDDLLRERLELPPLENKNAVIPARFAQEIARLEAAQEPLLQEVDDADRT